MTDENGEVEYGLVMPFVVCASKGGPYDDASYVAGWEAGALDLALKLQPLPRKQTFRVPQCFHSENRDQLDLIAMNHDLTARFEDAAEGWVYLVLTSK